MSDWVEVIPQAMEALCPRMTNGTPGTVAPETLSSGPSMRVRYHMIGAWKPKCGSLTRKAPMVSVREGASAQTLEAPRGAPGFSSGHAGNPASDATAPAPARTSAMVTGAPGGSEGQSSRTFSGPIFAAMRARNASSPQLPPSRAAMSLPHTSESAGFQGSGV